MKKQNLIYEYAQHFNMSVARAHERPETYTLYTYQNQNLVPLFKGNFRETLSYFAGLECCKTIYENSDKLSTFYLESLAVTTLKGENHDQSYRNDVPSRCKVNPEKAYL